MECSETSAILRPHRPCAFAGALLTAMGMLLIPFPASAATLVEAQPAEADIPSQTMYVLVDQDSWLNIRERPTLHADVTIRMERGDVLEVYSVSKDGWAEISRASDAGYCRAEYLTDTLLETPVPYLATAGKLMVRLALGGATLRRLKRGEEVAVAGWFTDPDGTRWANIGHGFVMARYLTPKP